MQQTQLLFTMIGVTLIIGTFFLFSIWFITRMQKYKKAAWEQMCLLAEITAQEKDKARITYNLHEDFAQLLATVKMFMGQFKLDSAYDIDLRQQTNHYLDNAISKVRGIALEYLPYSLQKENLEDTLQEYIKYINKSNNDLIKLTIKNTLPRISVHKAVSIYRMVQEIVSNTIQHAHATELVITIAFKEQNGKLLLATQDNGRGFDYKNELEKGTGSGLANIINRTKLLKGSIEVNSQSGGTMYLIVIPI